MKTKLNCLSTCIQGLVLTVVFLGIAACGPTLRSRPLKVHAYGSTRTCSQGPFVVDLPASGARWGEHIVIKAWSLRAIGGRYDIMVGDKVVSRGSFGKRHYQYRRTATNKGYPGWYQATVKGPDNSRCVAAAGTQPAPSATSSGGGSSGDATPSPSADAPRRSTTAPSPKVILFSSLSTAEYKERLSRRRNYLRYDLLDLSLGKVETPEYPDCKPSRKNEIPKNTRIRIRLWSETPNDMEGAWIEVQQNRFEPSVPEAKYLQHLDKRHAKCLKKTQRVAEKWKRRAKKSRTKRRTSRCRFLVPVPGAKIYAYRPTKYMDCSCRGDNRSAGCWGAAGFSGYLAKFRKNIRRYSCKIRVEVKQNGKPVYGTNIDKPCRCALDRTDRKCWGVGGYEAFARMHRAKYEDRKRMRTEVRERARLRRKLLSQPPPPPRSERRPPKPSRNAGWVPGYWVRIKGGPSAGRWGWIAGWWRVPKADVKQGLTTRTRRRPPPERSGVRRPPKPAPRAVWAPGYWHWTGSRHVWVHGAWRIPPRSQARWRRARWIRRGPFLILIPGGWVR